MPASFATLADVLYQARTILQDADGTRYSDNVLTEGAMYGLLDMQALRPDLFIGATPPPRAILDTSFNLSFLDPRYGSALVNYICYWAEQMDLEVTDASRAAMHLITFRQKLGVAK
jgi:hypothetical protein